MKFLIRKTPDGFIKSVNDEISSILSRNLDGLFPDEFIAGGEEELDKLAAWRSNPNDYELEDWHDGKISVLMWHDANILWAC